MIAGPHDTPGGRFRLVGFREEMGEDFAPTSSKRATTARSPAPPPWRACSSGHRHRAVFAASDLMAAGAIAALRKAGLRVPEDVAVADSTTPDSPPTRSHR